MKHITLKTKDELQPLITHLNSYLRSVSLTKNDEEKLKGDLKEFLAKRIKRYINSKENGIDLAIYSTIEKSKDMYVQVLIETKVPNSPEMIVSGNFNKKALHEAALYYLTERGDENNRGIEKIIISDFNNFYIFNGEQLDLKFERNRRVNKIFEQYNNPTGDKSTGRTSWFYDELEKAIEENPKDFVFDEVYSFNLLDFLNGEGEFSGSPESERLNSLDSIFSAQFLLGERQESMNATVSFKF